MICYFCARLGKQVPSATIVIHDKSGTLPMSYVGCCIKHYDAVVTKYEPYLDHKMERLSDKKVRTQ